MLLTTTLLVSRDRTLIDAVRGATRTIDHLRIEVVEGIEAACRLGDWDRVGLVVVHFDGDTEGLTRLLHTVAMARQRLATLVIGEHGFPDQAENVLRLGAAEYLPCPLDLDRLAYLIDILTVKARQPAPAEPPPASGPGSELEPLFYYTSPEMGRLMEQIRRIAPQESTLLLSGETGTGKTRLARLIHELSPRAQEPFLVVNCGALSANLIESEMFGHIRGAFTSADRDRVGKFAEVGRGTLLLDEIDSLPPSIQAKLLRVVEDRVFEAVGSNKTQPVQARLIAATNRDLEREMAEGRFRADLYYRLHVVGFTLPPLRERRATIAPLVRRFATEIAARNRWQPLGISDAAMTLLERHSWPGNIRELRNVIERAVTLCGGREVRSEDLPDSLRHEAASYSWNTPTPSFISPPPVRSAPPHDSTLAEIKHQAERSRISEALEKHRNNRLRAAGELGISRMTLYKKMYKYGLMNEPSRAARRGEPGGGPST